MEGAVALVLALLSIPFILPLVSYLMARKLRGRVDDLETRVVQQNDQILRLTLQLNKLKQEGVASAPVPPPIEVSEPVPAPAPPKPAVPPTPAPTPVVVRPPIKTEAPKTPEASKVVTPEAPKPPAP